MVIERLIRLQCIGLSVIGKKYVRAIRGEKVPPKEKKLKNNDYKEFKCETQAYQVSFVIMKFFDC